jgi:hypothetical protein
VSFTEIRFSYPTSDLFAWLSARIRNPHSHNIDRPAVGPTNECPVRPYHIGASLGCCGCLRRMEVAVRHPLSEAT